MVEGTPCAGCGTMIPVRKAGPRTGRSWCGGTCRTRTLRAENPEYFRTYGRELARRRTRERRAEVSTVRYSDCVECGRCFVLRPGQRSDRLTCSDRCKFSRTYKLLPPENRRQQRRNTNQRRRALLRTNRVEKFPDSEIFERDGWRCGICGKRVDRTLRNPHRLSASLDHVVPLAAGGEHSRANTQLAHLSCNSAKRDKAGGEQLRLTG